MLHRHLNHSDWTLAAIDDVIARGRLDDWKELRDAAEGRTEILDRILRVSEPDLLIRMRSDITSGIFMSESNLPEWDQLLSAAAHLQEILPDATLVGGTAVAIFAQHRFSRDTDHVLPDLRLRFDEVLEELEAVAGWRTARVKRPVLILGSLDGIETGVRQMIREQPLETQEVAISGVRLVVPTEEELLRIKGRVDSQT